MSCVQQWAAVGSNQQRVADAVCQARLASSIEAHARETIERAMTTTRTFDRHDALRRMCLVQRAVLVATMHREILRRAELQAVLPRQLNCVLRQHLDAALDEARVVPWRHVPAVLSFEF